MFSTVRGKLVIRDAEVMHTDQNSMQVSRTIMTEPMSRPAIASKGWLRSAAPLSINPHRPAIMVLTIGRPMLVMVTAAARPPTASAG